MGENYNKLKAHKDRILKKETSRIKELESKNQHLFEVGESCEQKVKELEKEYQGVVRDLLDERGKVTRLNNLLTALRNNPIIREDVKRTEALQEKK